MLRLSLVVAAKPFAGRRVSSFLLLFEKEEMGK